MHTGLRQWPARQGVAQGRVWFGGGGSEKIGGMDCWGVGSCVSEMGCSWEQPGLCELHLEAVRVPGGCGAAQHVPGPELYPWHLMPSALITVPCGGCDLPRLAEGPGRWCQAKECWACLVAPV